MRELEHIMLVMITPSLAHGADAKTTRKQLKIKKQLGGKPK